MKLMELTPQNDANLYGLPENKPAPPIDEEKEAERQRVNEELSHYNCVWIDGEWVSLGC